MKRNKVSFGLVLTIIEKSWRQGCRCKKTLAEVLPKAILPCLIIAGMLLLSTACGSTGLEDLLGHHDNYPSGEGPGYYEVGDTTPGGGFIFYYDEEGFIMTDTGERAYYLEAAPRDWNTSSFPLEAYFAWSPIYTSPPLRAYGNVGDTSFVIGAGRKNTALILAAAGGSLSTTAPAANACAMYSNDETSPGDWFLPSRNELNELYKFHVEVEAGNYPGLDTGLMDIPAYSTDYWSSSQASIDRNAWSQDFRSSEGTQRQDAIKPNAFFVRAIRAF